MATGTKLGSDEVRRPPVCSEEPDDSTPAQAPWAPVRKIGSWAIAAGLLCALAGGAASSQMGTLERATNGDSPDAEFHMVRLVYGGLGQGGFRGFRNRWWAIDYPDAEIHFLPALSRLTNLSVADDSRHLPITDDRIFKYPFAFMQQPGQGNWSPSELEAERLREYLDRGGFLLVDDFHGDYEWYLFAAGMKRVFPNREIVEIPDDDVLMNIFFDLDDRIQIPGLRHLALASGGQIVARMQGQPHWRGIYDDRGRLVVAISFNIDMGDAWEHADDAYYPAQMTGLAYRLGVNYVIYAMTH